MKILIAALVSLMLFIQPVLSPMQIEFNPSREGSEQQESSSNQEIVSSAVTTSEASSGIPFEVSLPSGVRNVFILGIVIGVIGTLLLVGIIYFIRKKVSIQIKK